MKLKLIQITALVCILVLGGCATTYGGKASDVKASTKNAKTLTAKDIVARYAAAIYGKDGLGLKKHPTMTMKGKVSIEQFNVEGPFVRYAMAPDSNVAVIELMGMKLNNGCHKGVCWTQQPGAGTITLSGAAAALQLQQADYALWEHMDRYYATLEIVAPAEGKESSIHKIKAVKKNGGTDYYDFSKESGLLIAGVIEGETAQGRMTVELQFKNYKEFDGMLVPMELSQATPQATLKLTFNEVSFAPLTEDKFARPN